MRKVLYKYVSSETLIHAATYSNRRTFNGSVKHIEDNVPDKCANSLRYSVSDLLLADR